MATELWEDGRPEMPALGFKVSAVFLPAQELVLGVGRRQPHPVTSRKTMSYLQNLNRIFSNTSTGPVLPKMVRGCPANKE